MKAFRPSTPDENPDGNGHGGNGDAPDPHRRYAHNLTPEERQLLRLRVELYENSWDRMLADLQDRLKGRPYIFKLVHRIEQDIDRLQKLQSYETKHRIDLTDFLGDA